MEFNFLCFHLQQSTTKLAPPPKAESVPTPSLSIAINTYSGTDNDITYLGDVLKMNFAKPKFRELLHIREIHEKFVP